MSDVATTRLSSKGQVVIPEEIRARLGLKAGVQFVVVGERDVVILKAIQAPTMTQFDELLARARKAAKVAGLRQKDISTAIKAVRSAR
jgi:AbrB family looped-hinge helix DNA binding protein